MRFHLKARNFFTLWMLLLLCACQSQPGIDPFESYNRKMFHFNQAADQAFFRPITSAYTSVIARPIRQHISNALSNLTEPANAANELLQGSVPLAFKDLWRFVLNSTLGILGLFDVADEFGLPKHPQDFGQTLAHWGYQDSTFIVLPLLGPSTFRDTLGLGVQTLELEPYRYVDQDWRTGILIMNIIKYQNRSLPASKLSKTSHRPIHFHA